MQNTFRNIAMRNGCLRLLLMMCAFAVPAFTQNCPARPVAGSIVEDPLTLTSTNGVLQVGLTIQNYQDFEGTAFYCYNYQGITEAPLLQVNPGDHLQLTLSNNIQGSGQT